MREDSSRKTRGFTVSAFLVEGIAALVFVGMLVLGDHRMRPIDGFVLWTLMLGFFSALGSMLIATPNPQRVAVRIARAPERRRADRRVLDLGSPTGIERRRGRDRRAVLTHSGFFAR